MRRHWQLVCFAFSFCWYHQGHAAPVYANATSVQESQAAKEARSAAAELSSETAGGKKRRVLESFFLVSIKCAFRGEEGSESQRSLLVGHEEEVISGVDGGKQYNNVQELYQPG